jgi:integrase
MREINPNTARSSRRTYGRGSIEARGPRVWIVRLSHRRDPATGKRVRESRMVKVTRRDAERVLAELLRLQETYGPTPTTSASMSLDRWMETYMASADLSDRTRADQRWMWQHYSTPALRSTNLRNLSTALLIAHVAALRARTSAHTGRPLSARTIQIYLNVVRAALGAAVKAGILPANPSSGVTVKGSSATSKASSAFTPEEMQRILAADPTDRLDALWMTLALTGLRPGEGLALWWEDFSAEAGTLQVRRAISDGADGRPVFGHCKALSGRTIHLDAALVARLQQHRRRQVEERLKLGERWVDDRLIFASEIGTVLDRHNVATRFRRRCRMAKVPVRRLYDLRHSVGTALIAQGNDAKSVSEILGHRSVVTTLAHYVHPNADDHRRAMRTLPWAEVGTQ